MASIAITINGTDRTKYVQSDSLQIDNILTRQVDRCKFSVQKVYGGSILNYTPSIGHEVIITRDGTKIFAGLITRITQKLNSQKILVYDLDMEDYTRLLDRKLVPDTYTDMTIDEIIASMIANYINVGDGITVNSNCPITIDYIAFNYLPISKCLTQLADFANYDWYIDYDKVIQFFAKDALPAPVVLSDTNGSYLDNSLVIRRDNSQVRNVIYVRGGKYLGDTFTTEIEATGVDAIYPLGYKYQDLSVTLTGQPLSVGLDNLDLADDYDLLWNFQEKIIKFKDADIPSSGAVMRVGGRPYLPVRVKVRDEVSINSMATAEGGSGEYEFLIIDNTIESRQEARDRATAELNSYKQTLDEGSFRTYVDGFRAGQQLTINSTAHDINETFVVNRVTTKMWTADRFIYDIQLVTTKTFGIIEYLQQLLIDKTKEFKINENEIIDVVEAASETIDISETILSSITHNPQGETITVDETVTAQSLNYDITWVLGDYSPPSGVNRIFILNSGLLE
jgi:hypothetical protein